jgi:hypothetical protein
MEWHRQEQRMGCMGWMMYGMDDGWNGWMMDGWNG